jgi:hypothetical protein
MGSFVCHDIVIHKVLMMKKLLFTPASIVGLIVLYAALYAWQPGGVRLLKILSDTLLAIFGLLAAVLALKASQMFEPGVASRRVWLLFGVGMAILTATQLLWTFYHIFLDRAEPYFSLADLLWVIGYIPILGSLVLQYRALGVGTSLRLKLTVFAAYSIALIIAFVILLWPTLSQPGQATTIEILVTVYYLIGDLGMAFIATLSLLVLWNSLVGRPWLYIVISMLLVAVADLLFSYGLLNDLYAIGSNLFSGVVDVVYLSAYVVAAAGAYRQVTLSLPPLNAE